MEKEVNLGNEKEWFRNHLAHKKHEQQPQDQQQWQWEWQAQQPTTEVELADQYGYQHQPAEVHLDSYANYGMPTGKSSQNEQIVHFRLFLK